MLKDDTQTNEIRDIMYKDINKRSKIYYLCLILVVVMVGEIKMLNISHGAIY